MSKEEEIEEAVVREAFVCVQLVVAVDAIAAKLKLTLVVGGEEETMVSAMLQMKEPAGVIAVVLGLSAGGVGRGLSARATMDSSRELRVCSAPSEGDGG